MRHYENLLIALEMYRIEEEKAVKRITDFLTAHGIKSGTNLTNLMKIKFRDLGIRVIYKIERVYGIMKIIVVFARTDEQVYKESKKKRKT